MRRDRKRFFLHQQTREKNIEKVVTRGKTVTVSLMQSCRLHGPSVAVGFQGHLQPFIEFCRARNVATLGTLNIGACFGKRHKKRESSQTAALGSVDS